MLWEHEPQLREHEQQLREHELQLREHEQQQQEHEQQLREHDQQLREHEQQLQEHEQQLREHEQQLREHEQQLFKKGSKRELGNYRPILVLPLISKLSEKNICRQLYDYFQENSLLNTYQFGFWSMPASWNFEVGQAIIKQTNTESYNDA